MKMTYYPFQPFEISPGKITVVETGNRDVLRSMILNFKDVQDDIHFSDDDFRLIDTEKALHWFGDTFVQNDLNKQFQARLHKHLKGIITPEQVQRIFELSQQLKNTVLDASYLLDLPLQVGDQIEIEKVLKFCELQFAPVTLTQPYDIIEAILKVSVELDDTKTLGFMNVSDYLTRDEFSELDNLAHLLNIKILLIKFSEINRHELFKNCRYYYVDDDYVDWRYE